MVHSQEKVRRVHQETGTESRIASDSSSEPKSTARIYKPDKKLVCIVYVVHSYMTFNLISIRGLYIIYEAKNDGVGGGGRGGGYKFFIPTPIPLYIIHQKLVSYFEQRIIIIINYIFPVVA